MKQIDRFNIELVENANGLDILLKSSNGSMVGKTNVNKKSKRVVFSDASSIVPPANSIPLQDMSVDLTKYFSRGLAGGSGPEMVILDAAFQFVLQNIAPTYDEPSIDAEDFDVILNARSDIPNGNTATDGGSTSASTGSSRMKPKRRKTPVSIWL